MLSYKYLGLKKLKYYNTLPAHFVPSEMSWKRRGSSRRV